MTPPYFPVDELALTGPMGLVPGSIDGPDVCGQAEPVTRESWRTRVKCLSPTEGRNAGRRRGLPRLGRRPAPSRAAALASLVTYQAWQDGGARPAPGTVGGDLNGMDGQVAGSR